MKAIRLITTCLPDYFQGSSETVLNVPVDGSTTYRELRESLNDEIRGTCGQLETWSDLDIFQGLNDMFADVTNEKALAFPDLEPRSEDEMGESVYAYFEFSDTE